MESQFRVFRLGHLALHPLLQGALVGCALVALGGRPAATQSPARDPSRAALALLVRLDVPARLTAAPSGPAQLERVDPANSYFSLPVRVASSVAWDLALSGAGQSPQIVEALDATGEWRRLDASRPVRLRANEAPTEPATHLLRLRVRRGVSPAQLGDLRLHLNAAEGGAASESPPMAP